MSTGEDLAGSGSEALMIVTGLTKEKVSGNGSRSAPPEECYLCKRKSGSKSIIMVQKEGEEEYTLIENELKTGFIERQRSGGTFIFRVCFECVILFDLESGS